MSVRHVCEHVAFPVQVLVRDGAEHGICMERIWHAPHPMP